MTKREFIKTSITGMAGLCFLSSFQNFDRFDEKKVNLPVGSKKSNSDTYCTNMAFGHSLPHLEFNQKI